MQHSEEGFEQPQVLLSAYQCAPGQGSVSQIGWEWYSRLSRRIPVTLITHSRNRAALVAAGTPVTASNVIFVNTEWFAGPLYRTASALFPKSQHAVFLLSSLDFYVYDFLALRQLRKQKQSTWNIIHSVTPVSPLSATRLFKLGPPLILGPWNGGMTSPSGFKQIMRDDSAWLYRIRDAGKLVDRVLGCTKRAAVVLSASSATDQSIPVASRSHLRRMIENGVDLSIFYPAPRNSSSSTGEPLRVLFVGRLIPVKGIYMLLEAVARVRREIELQLTIVGDGPIRTDIEREIGRLDLRNIVRLTGNLPAADVAAHMRSCDIFCLPSVRESGGAVLLEAMACSVPVVAVNYGGPAEIVDDEVGRLLSAESPEALISDLASVFREAASCPAAWCDRGIEGRKRAEARYGWDAKISSAIDLYREVLSTAARRQNAGRN